MNLVDYYKAHIYDYGYNNGYDKLPNAVGSVDYDDCDYDFIADYIRLYDVSKDDIKFIQALGYEPEHFDDFEWENVK